MPKSKRSKVVSLTKTDKKVKEDKKKLVNELRENLDKYEHCWVFSVGDMRNEALKEVRKQWKTTGRLFYGRNKVMAIALGLTPEQEYKEGLSQIAKKLRGPLGLFLTSHDPKETQEWFESFSVKEFARMGNRATSEVILPDGPILSYDSDPFPHSMDPQLRSLGLATVLVKGVPSLHNPHVVCRNGEKLTAEKARLLKLLGIQMAEFKVKLGDRWTRDVGFVPGAELDADGSDDEAMDE